MECAWDNDSDLSHLAMVCMCIFVLNGSLNIFLAFNNVLLLLKFMFNQRNTIQRFHFIFQQFVFMSPVF
jgi:hypothetical protein